jgi:hypothetical protein
MRQRTGLFGEDEFFRVDWLRRSLRVNLAGKQALIGTTAKDKPGIRLPLDKLLKFFTILRNFPPDCQYNQIQIIK